jgi:hypothetical protein
MTTMMWPSVVELVKMEEKNGRSPEYFALEARIIAHLRGYDLIEPFEPLESVEPIEPIESFESLEIVKTWTPVKKQQELKQEPKQEQKQEEPTQEQTAPPAPIKRGSIKALREAMKSVKTVIKPKVNIKGLEDWADEKSYDPYLEAVLEDEE